MKPDAPKPICPACGKPLFVSGSLHLGGIVATCPTGGCINDEIVEVAETPLKAIAAFHGKALRVGKREKA